ncbi:MAG: hypothetical protein KDB00_28690 [Planctomycetales bacterium]|nr:hypothetical protein [Planctomycetales bacterium]
MTDTVPMPRQTSAATKPADPGLNVCIDGGGLITRTESRWLIQVGREQVELAANTDPKLAAERFANLCDDVKGVQRRCVLALDASECFFASFEVPDSIDASDRGAITYELERHIPLDAEAMVSDHSISAANGRVAAVAVQIDRQRQIIDALESSGIEVVSIIPLAFLAARRLQQIVAQRSKPEPNSLGLLMFHDGSVDAMTVDVGGIVRWRQFGDSEVELRRHQVIDSDHIDSSAPLWVVEGEDRDLKTSRPVHHCESSFIQLAAAGTNLALRGRWGRWPDLRRGGLAPRDPLFAVAGPLRMFAISAVASLIVIAVAAWFRGERLAEQSERVRQQQRAAFTSAYPARRVPVMLMRTIRSEHNKALGSRGRGDTIDLPIPATTVLRQVYRGLEHAQTVQKIRLRLTDINIVDGECSLTVRAVDAVEIGVIAKSLETVGFEVQPPASEQIQPSKDEPIATYQSTIMAVWRDKKTAIDEADRT